MPTVGQHGLLYSFYQSTRITQACSVCYCMPCVFQVMEAYAGGLKAMKAALQAQPLSREELEDVMDQLHDVSAVICGCYSQGLQRPAPQLQRYYALLMYTAG